MAERNNDGTTTSEEDLFGRKDVEATYRTFRLWRPRKAWLEMYLSWFPEIRLKETQRFKGSSFVSIHR